MIKVLILLLLANLAWSQFLDEADIVLPTFAAKNDVDKEVKSFLDENEKTDSLFAVSVQRDVLGRKQQNSIAYLSDGKVNRIKVVVSKIKEDIPFLGKIYGRYELSEANNSKKYWLNGEQLNERSYFKEFDSLRKKIKNGNYYKSPEIRYMSADEIRELLNGTEPVSISIYKNPVPASNDTTIGGRIYYRDSVIRSLSQIESYAFGNGYKGNGVGIYFTETGCPKSNYVNWAKYTQGNGACYRGERTHPTGVVRVLQTTAPEANIYGFDQINRPENPMDYDVPLYIGSHSWSLGDDSIYSNEDKEFDNYVYNEGVIEFICAGNKNGSSDTYYVTTPGKSVNSITVGYFPNDAAFSVNEDGVIKTYNGTFDGTSASTPYTAALAANVLSQHPFFKTHPEMFKALMMTGSTLSVSNYWDRDNYTRIRMIPQYFRMGWNTRSAYWNGNNADFFSSDSTITFTESGIVSGGRYRIAISWLVNGDYVKLYNLLPQDLNMYVYQNGQLLAKSDSPNNPFELVDVTTNSSLNLQIVIKRTRNSGSDKVILGYNFLYVN